MGGNGTDWDDFKAGVDENLDKLQESFSDWKTGLMNEYLLNEDVYIFDFANHADGHMCFSIQNRPCCISRNQMNMGDQASWDQYREVQSAYRADAFETIECRSPYGMEHDDKNACFLTDLNTVCDGTY